MREDFYLEMAESKPATAVEPLFRQEVPEAAEKAYQRALGHLRTGDRTRAQAALQEAVGILPRYFLALRQLGLESMQRGESEEAEGWFRRAVEVNPNSASAQFGLGWAHYQAGRLEEAVRVLTLSAQLNRQASETH
jgi:Tfp pilus assembly protein PilF